MPAPGARRRPSRNAAASAVAAAIAALPLAACEQQPTTPPEPLAVEVGPDRTVVVGEAVELLATSTGGVGSTRTFAWSLETAPLGSTATVAASGADAHVTPDLVGSYDVVVTVSDGTSQASEAVRIDAEAGPDGVAAVAPIEPQRGVPGEVLEAPINVLAPDPATVTIEPHSGDADVLADDAIEVLGSGEERLLRVTVGDAHPVALAVTVVARDAQGVGSGTSFELIVATTLAQGPALSTDARPPEAGDHFGFGIAIDGEVAVVGAPASSHGEDLAGVAYAYLRGPSGWEPHGLVVPQHLGAGTASAHAGATFGWAVDVSGDHVIVGAPGWSGDATGAAYLFERCTTTCITLWPQVAPLAGDGGAGDRFGDSVAIQGSLAVVGAPGEDGVAAASGAVYVVEHDGEDWGPAIRLEPADAGEDHRFGARVATDGARVLASAPGADDLAGAIYVFEWGEDGWSETARIQLGDAPEQARLGQALAIDAGTIAASGLAETDTDVILPAVHLFELEDGTWHETARIAVDPDDGDRIRDIALEGPYALVGLPEAHHYDTWSGGALLLARFADDWRAVERVAPDPALPIAWFGHAVALGPGDALVGSPTDAAADGGAAFVLSCSPAFCFVGAPVAAE
jgi:hypothetical protein